MAKDVVTFLSWAAEPEHDERKKTGIKAVIIFSTLFALSVAVKRFKWNVIKNRKIGALTAVSGVTFVLNSYYFLQSTTLPLTRLATRAFALFLYVCNRASSNIISLGIRHNANVWIRFLEYLSRHLAKG